MPGILVRPRRDPLAGMTRDEVLVWLRQALAGRVRAAYLFGSFVRSDLGPWSDIDCILVAESDLPFPVRGRRYEDLRDRLPALALLVYTPVEFEALTSDPSPGFWTSVTRDMMRVL